MRMIILLKNNGLMIFISLLALVLRLINLTRYDLWHDEIASLFKVKISSLWYLSTNFPSFQPLYNLFLTYWQVLGDTPLILKFSSVISGIISVFVIYLLGRELFNKKAGIICAFLFSISPFSIQYSQELRPYSLLILLILISTFSFVKLLNKGSFLSWVINIAANILSVYLIFTSIFIPFLQMLFIVFRIRKVRTSEILLFQSLQLILLLPWFYIAIKNLIFMLNVTKTYHQFSPFLNSVSLISLLDSFKNLVSGYFASNYVRIPGLVLFIFLMAKGAVDLFLQNKRHLFLLSFLFIPILSLFMFSKFRVFYAERYVVYSIIFLYLIAGLAISRMNRIAMLVCLLLCCLLSALSLNNYYSNNNECNYLERQGTNPKKEFRKAAYFLKNNYHPGDLVIHTSKASTLSLEYYLNENNTKVFLDYGTSVYKFMVDALVDNKENTFLIIHELGGHDFYFYKNRDFFIKQKSDELLERNERIWLILSAWEYPFQFKAVNDWLGEKYTLKISGKFQGIEVYLYINK